MAEGQSDDRVGPEEKQRSEDKNGKKKKDATNKETTQKPRYETSRLGTGETTDGEGNQMKEKKTTSTPIN